MLTLSIRLLLDIYQCCGKLYQSLCSTTLFLTVQTGSPEDALPSRLLVCSAIYRGVRDVQSGRDMDVTGAYPGPLRTSVPQVYLAQGAVVLTLVEQLVADRNTATSAKQIVCLNHSELRCVQLASVLRHQESISTTLRDPSS